MVQLKYQILLVIIYQLENKKDKPEYKSWNEALPRYFKAVGKF